MAARRRFARICVALPLLLPAGAPPAASLRWARASEQRLDIVSRPEQRAGLPYFDASGGLRWDAGAPTASPETLCKREDEERAGDGNRSRQRVWLLQPRVEEVDCPVARGSEERFLVGLGAGDGPAWVRRLRYPSGGRGVDEWVLGATNRAIVLSDLEVVSPATGERLAPAPSRLLAAEGRRVPLFDLQHPAVYLPRQRVFVTFDAEVTAVSRRGGLVRWDAASGQRDLLVPVSATWLGGAWRVEDMLLDEEERLLYLAQRLDVRGAGAVAFVVYDLAAARLLFRDVPRRHRFVRAPKLALGPDGWVGMSFLDDTAAQVVLVRYRTVASREEER